MANPVLTAADPEPAAWTIVRDDTGCQWVRQPGREPCGWISEHDKNAADPESWAKVAGNYGPVIVLFMPPADAPELKPKPDLTTQIRERLDGWAPPEPWLNQFADAEPRTPDEPAALAEDLGRAIEAGAFSGPVLVLPPSPRSYPGFEQMRAALLAVLDRHAPDSSGDCPRCMTVWPEGTFHETAPCDEVEAIAEKLGIEVDHG